MNYTRALCAVLLAASLAACGGGSTSGGGVTPTAPGHGSTPQGRGTISVKLSVPPSKTQSANTQSYLRMRQAAHNVRTKYISGATTEIDFTLTTENGVAASSPSFNFTIYTNSSSNCTGSNSAGYTCSVLAPAPAGPDTYLVQAQQCSVAGTGTCASLGGTLTVLSQAYVTINVPLNQTVLTAFTLSPIVASIDWAPVSYALVSGPSPLQTGLWLTNPNGPNSPSYNPNPTPGSYACASNIGSGTGNGCWEPAAQGTSIAYGETLEARDPTGAIIIGASGGAVFQTPLYLGTNGNAITINWSCNDATGGTSLTLESGGGPYSPNSTAPTANQSFNSPTFNPALDPDGGYTTDGNGNPVTAIGNNGVEMNWDGVDQPLLATPDSCSASTSNGLSTSASFYVGLGQGGVEVQPGTTPDGNVYEVGFSGYLGSSSTSLFGFTQDAYSSPATTITSLPAVDWNAKSNPLDSMAFDSNGNLWIISQPYYDEPDNVVEYLSTDLNNPNATPAVSFTTATTDANANSFAIDSAGNIYIADSAQTQVEVYNSSNSYAAPIHTISGPATGLLYPTSVAIDSSGNLWVGNADLGALGTSYLLNVFANPGSANGNVAPTQSFLNTQWSSSCEGTPYAGLANMAFDAKGNLVLMNAGPEFSISVLPAGFTNATCPVAGFNVPEGGGQTGSDTLAVDDNGYIYVGNSTNQIGIYPESATDASNGMATPYALINGGVTGGASTDVAGLALSTASGWYSGSSVHRHALKAVTHR